MSQSSRMESARRRVRTTQYAIGVIAVGAFAGGAVVARAAHPGTHHGTSTSAQAAIPSESSSVQAAAGSFSTSSSSNSSSSSSSSVSPAPAASPPVVQSSGS